MKPISLLADSSFVRAFPGGVGQYKLGCNYCPTILVGRRAIEMGCQQVLWLFDEDEKLTEVGTMNIFVYWTNEQGGLF
jgi:branched-chain amino acid aminotransferase